MTTSFKPQAADTFMKQVSLADWADFEDSLRAELAALGYTGKVVARNFALTTFDADHTEIDRLAMVINTGTDRSPDSPFWNEPGFDHDHDGDPRGKQANEIVYAFTLDLQVKPYLVFHDVNPTSFDITEGLSPYDGIVIYDHCSLDRVSKNEYWFNCKPLNAALLVFTLANVDGEA